ncbi:MAG: ABC transporter ATP-binding protein [Tissierellales bacterium]|nr:ABC transporter ATP-binding protein [Tissierellales bacterium]
MIKIRNLRKVYKIGKEKVVALNKIDLDIYKGEICCILGTSGSGKSTLLNMMAGLEKPTKGYVDIKDERVTKMNEKTLASFRQKHVGFIFQSYNLIPTLTAEENVSLPLTFRGVPKHIRDKRAKKYLKAVELENYIKHKPTQMSGGQQQRVGIARAFTGEPSILFADEPTGNLDSKTTSKIMGIMLDLAEKNDQTMIMVTHDREIAQYADKVVYVLDGNIVKVEVKEKEDVRRYVHHAKKIAEEQKEKK